MTRARCRRIVCTSPRLGGEAKWARPLALVQACQLVSFALTTLRTFAGLPRIKLILREAIVLSVALLGLHMPRAAQVIRVRTFTRLAAHGMRM